MNISWRNDNEHVEVKTNKNIQQNNVKEWQNLESYRKSKNIMETIKSQENNEK